VVTTWGANADQLEAVATALGRAADLIDQNRVRINSQVHHAPWRGAEADRFRSDWDQIHVRRLISAAGFLQEARTRLQQNAADQRAASESLTGGAASRSLASHPAGRSSIDNTWLYRAANDVVFKYGGFSTTALHLVAKGFDSPLTRIGEKGATAFDDISLGFDSFKLGAHLHEGNTSDVLYDTGHVALDSVALVALASNPAGWVVGATIGAGAVLWEIGAHDTAVMRNMHAAGNEYAAHHYRSAAGDVGKGLVRFGSDLSSYMPMTPFPEIRLASRFLHRT